MSDTRKKIFDISLELFSQKGFDAVSVRDICGQVHIKESSMYYHFKNKQAIFDEILLLFDEKSSNVIKMLEQELDVNLSYLNEGNYYETIFDIFFDGYFLDPFCNKVMRLLTIESSYGGTVQDIYENRLFEEILCYFTNMFLQLVKRKILPDTDCRYLAVKFYSPIFFFAQRWLFHGQLTDMRKNLFLNAAYGHIKNFFVETGIAQWQ